ncbi:MAG: 16S rRNA (guanine527-N7)-methyltransferase [Bacteroidia bacterium]|jgi:16S rRNA (guanine527-N7)-methyltransferase
MELIKSYFPNLKPAQYELFEEMAIQYERWNSEINVISRKDIAEIETHHILHSLAIAKFTTFAPDSFALDAGTGGGFPGIPLAVLFPNTTFHLVDSIGKKIKVVKAIAQELELTNVIAEQKRLEDLPNQYDYVVSRAVTQLERFFGWTNKNLKKRRFENSGLYALKGGDLQEELFTFSGRFPTRKTKVKSLSEVFKEGFFETKKLVIVQ